MKAAAIAAVMRQLEREDGTRTVVGVDGGVFEHYGNYREAIKAGLVDIMGKKAAEAVEFKHVNDGSSLGAAYLAAAKVRAGSLQNGEQSASEIDNIQAESLQDGEQSGSASDNIQAESLQNGEQSESESDLEKENRGQQQGPSTPTKSGDKTMTGKQGDAE